MPTVSIHMPEQSGETGQVLYLRKVSDGTLLNAGGDALAESPASSGRFTATVAESITETLHAVVVSGSLTVRDGWMASGETIVRDGYPELSSVERVAVSAAVWDRVLTGATHNIVNSAGRRLRQIDAAAVVDAGTAQAGGATSITLAATASSTNDIYNGDRVEIIAGTGAGENAIITDYDGTTKVATVTPAFVITPDATSEYQIVPATSTVASWAGTAVTGDGDWAGLESSIAALNDLDSTAVQAAAAAALNAYDPPTNAEMEARTLEAADYATAAALTAAPAEVITLLGSGTEVYGHSYLESIKRIEVVSGAATLSGAGTGTEVMTSSDSSKTATFTVDGSGNVSAVVWS